MAKYIVFDFFTQTDKTKVWEVLTSDRSTILGYVKWFGRWRQYAFFPENGMLFEKGCLRDLADFCEQQTKLKRVKP